MVPRCTIESIEISALRARTELSRSWAVKGLSQGDAEMGASDHDRGFGEPPHSASVVASGVAAQDSSRMTEASPATVKRRVLVVEDEMLIGMLLEDMLADLGHDVAAIVPRLKDALAAVDSESYDLAILDVHLHGESAFPVAEALIAKKVPFVFATGYGERGLPEAYRGRPVLQKPFAKDDLDRAIKTLLPQR
jgi:CheY-like chemotaxis protein